MSDHVTPGAAVEPGRAWWARPERWAALVACGFAGFAFAAVPLLTIGWFGPIQVAAGTVALGGLLAWCAVDFSRAPVARCDPRWFWAGVLVLAVLSGGVNAARSNEHALLNRDPGVYFTAALQLSHHGSPTYRPDGGGFRGHGLKQAGPGLIPASGGRIGFQGLHLLPAFAAAAGWIAGPNALARTPALLGGLFLVFVMAFARRVVGSMWALLGGATFAVMIPFVNGSRDFLSEMVMGPAIFAALWVLADMVDESAESPSWRPAVLVGALLGAAAMARIDALLGLIGAVGFLGLWLIADRRRDGRLLVALVVPMLVGVAVSGADGWVNGQSYVRSQAGDLIGEFALLGLVALGLGAWAVIDRRWRPGLRAAWVRRRGPAAVTLVVLIVAAAGLALFVRPHVQHAAGLPTAELTEGYQRGEGLAINGRRSYDEWSTVWLVWYLGVVGFAAALAGGAWLVHRLVRGGANRVEALLLAVLVPPLIVYLYKPSIYPDQPWASRRFLPEIFPLLVVLACWCGARLWEQRGRRAVAGRVLAAGLGAGILLLPLLALRPIWRFRTYNDSLGQVDQVCDALPPDAAVLMVGDPAQTYTRVIGVRCSVPAASIVRHGGRATSRQVASIAAGWRRAGRALWLVSPVPDDLAALGVTDAQRFDRIETTALHGSLLHRPDTFVTTRTTFVVAPAVPRRG